jgi:group I intron endonuclease
MTDVSAGVYRIRNTVNGKVYVGSSVNVRRRIWRHKDHLRKCCHENQHLQNAFNKYGADCLSFERVVALKDKLFWEQFFINNYHSYDKQFGYNKSPTAGSSLGVKLSEEACRKLSIAIKIAQNKPEVREATRRRSIELGLHKNFGDVSGEHNGMYGTHRAGAKAPFYGKAHKEGTKSAIRQALTGRKLTEEHKKHVAEAGKIAQNRPEILEANRNRSIGSGNPMYGKSMTDFMTQEAIEQMRAHMSASGKHAWADPERHRQWSEILRKRHFGNYLTTMKDVVVRDWT